MFPILNPPPTSLPIPSLWVIPVHQPQGSCILHRTWTGDSRFVSHMLIYMFQCHSPKSSHPRSLGILSLPLQCSDLQAEGELGRGWRNPGGGVSGRHSWRQQGSRMGLLRGVQSPGTRSGPPREQNRTLTAGCARILSLLVDFSH